MPERRRVSRVACTRMKNTMITPDDQNLKAEIEAISKNIDAILEKIEAARPQDERSSANTEDLGCKDPGVAGSS
jgi:hypothetical protein